MEVNWNRKSGAVVLELDREQVIKRRSIVNTVLKDPPNALQDDDLLVLRYTVAVEYLEGLEDRAISMAMLCTEYPEGVTYADVSGLKRVSRKLAKTRAAVSKLLAAVDKEAGP